MGGPAGLKWNDPQTNENLRSGEMLVPGDQWPIFLYARILKWPQRGPTSLQAQVQCASSALLCFSPPGTPKEVAWQSGRSSEVTDMARLEYLPITLPVLSTFQEGSSASLAAL
ncbi:uncharacterized protein F5147DRAFT_659078 [Suillus discolor]|uniref:Uncharacterized protein n=1 Tax=Suillus discolor TaxID=1912936 RepID=A0A9P7ERJ8_9AGAM|nr:uncharacterized protein F5147DRAFT_659078 [Suillus discolor]KAG2086960.1 hypothetical protein F5147DRAFT_659078 [Suillus discolor]